MLNHIRYILFSQKIRAEIIAATLSWHCFYSIHLCLSLFAKDDELVHIILAFLISAVCFSSSSSSPLPNTMFWLPLNEGTCHGQNCYLVCILLAFTLARQVAMTD